MTLVFGQGGTSRVRRRTLGAWIVVLGLCACGLANVRLLLGEFGPSGELPQTYMPSVMIDRFRPLATRVEPGVTLGYYLDLAHADTNACHPDERFYLAQYALSPLLVERSVAHRFVVVDADEPNTRPALAVEGGWTLTIDLGNGVCVYQTPNKGS